MKLKSPAMHSRYLAVYNFALVHSTMSSSIRAHINPKLLIWARECCYMDTAYAAPKLGVAKEKLEQWESGHLSPTIPQLRKLAKVYKVNFGALFLPEPPETFKPPVKDYRLHHGAVAGEIDPEIAIDLRLHLNIRETALELGAELEEEQAPFKLSCSMDDSPTEVAERIRTALGISFQEQKKFRESRVAFNAWRNAIAATGVLVIQSSKVDLNNMRGYSVFFDKLPLLVVNRQDAYAARTFTLMHEFTHLLLRSSGLCDLRLESGRPPHEQKLEVFCNAVAAQVLVPDALLLDYPEIKGVAQEAWFDEILRPIARDFGVSKEVVLRKLLDQGLTTQAFYLKNRERYIQEAIEYKRKQKDGFVEPAVDVVSTKGRQYVSLVLEALNASVITAGDAADFLDVKAKHFSAIESNLRQAI